MNNGGHLKLHWQSQMSPRIERCSGCRSIMSPWTHYFRAVHELDGRDEYGYDVCTICRRELPDEPEALHV
jgi:hypothetical protein